MADELPEEFLRGVALFNDGKFFECHEVWEGIWIRAEGERRQFLHAMIQAAAALHHLQRGNLKGARGVGRRAAETLGRLPASMMRLDTRAFRAALEQSLMTAGAPLPRIQI